MRQERLPRSIDAIKYNNRVPINEQMIDTKRAAVIMPDEQYILRPAPVPVPRVNRYSKDDFNKSLSSPKIDTNSAAHKHTDV